MAGAATAAHAAPLPAQTAGTPEAFAGTASALALKLDLFGTNLTVGSTSAEADTTPQATASGAGVALIAATTSSATANNSKPTVAALPGNGACGLSLPIGDLANVALACSNTTASIAGGAPTAGATSNIADIDVNLLNPVLQLLQPILNALEPIANQLLGTVLTTVQSTVQPLLGNLLPNLLGSLGISLTQPVSSLITALQKATNLATIHVGDSLSGVTTTAGSVVATAQAQGAQIDVLPGILLNGGPLLSITVGQANTTSTYNRATGDSTAAFTPALLTIDLLGNPITVALGGTTLLAGTPLASTIELGGGSCTPACGTPSSGKVSATASALKLDLLTGLNGGIDLELATANSAAGGTVATAAITTTTTTTAPPVVSIAPEPITLATTGTSAPLLPIGFFLILAGYITRRTYRSRRAARTPR